MKQSIALAIKNPRANIPSPSPQTAGSVTELTAKQAATPKLEPIANHFHLECPKSRAIKITGARTLANNGLKGFVPCRVLPSSGMELPSKRKGH